MNGKRKSPLGWSEKPFYDSLFLPSTNPVKAACEPPSPYPNNLAYKRWINSFLMVGHQCLSLLTSLYNLRTIITFREIE
jgi:hypothetical protein